MPEPRARLPKGLPPALADFIRCRADRAVVDPGRLDWLPRPKNALIPDTPPELGFEPGEGEAVVLRVGWGMIGVNLTARVVDGRLVVETENPLLPRADLQKWVDDLNADLRSHGKAFDKVEVAAGRLTMTKKPLAVAPAAVSVAVAPASKGAVPAAPAPAAPAPVLGPQAPGPLRRFVESWQGKAGIAAGALALGAAAFFLFTDDGEKPAAVGATTSTATTAATTSTAAAAPGGGLPATGSPGAGSNGQVGALPRCDEAYTEEEYAAALETLRAGPLLGLPEGLLGAFPEHPAFADPALHLPCGGFAGPFAFADAPVFPGIFGAGPGDLVVSHQGSVPDAATGEVGLSMVRWAFPTSLPGATPVFLVDDCAGRTVTGAGEVADGLASGSGPLFQYGPCAFRRLFATVEGVDIASAGKPLLDFVVGPEEGILGSSFLDVPALLSGGPADGGASHLLDAAQVIGAAFEGMNPGNDSCLWFFEPSHTEAVVRALDCGGSSRWVFAPPEGRLPAGGTGIGVAASMLGITPPPAAETVASLFGGTLFPCGPGRLALAVCGGGEEAPAGPWVFAQVVLEAPLPLAPGPETAVGVGFDLDGDAATGNAFGAGAAGGVEVEYRLAAGAGGSWALTRHDGAATTARALIRGNSVTFVISSAEVGAAIAGYRSYAAAAGTTSALPPLGREPVAGAPEALGLFDVGAAGAAVSTAPAEESVTGFIADFAAAIAAADVAFLYDRLHPLVPQTFGEEACRAFLEREVLALQQYRLAGAVAGPETGLVAGVEVPDLFRVPVAFTYQGQLFEAEAVVALVDGEMRWFTECR
jgi:hypothetical protein